MERKIFELNTRLLPILTNKQSTKRTRKEILRQLININKIKEMNKRTL